MNITSIKHKLIRQIERHWYKQNSIILSIIFLPLSYIYFFIIYGRKKLYQLGYLPKFSLPVPVVVIGNITVGGVGKTPLTQTIAQTLLSRGVKVGVILRGYKSNLEYPTKVVYATDDSYLVGDEALIYAQHNIPVAIGKNRYLAGITLLNKYPNIEIILSDDGLQHYRLMRDFEIAVIDSRRLLGNKFLLPMGPLRELPLKLKQVNAIVFNDHIPLHIDSYMSLVSNLYEQKIILDKIYFPQTKNTLDLNDLKFKKVAAIAAIGNPKNFFMFLHSLKIDLKYTQAFPDHYAYIMDDVPQNYDLILVTEKDYTKLAKFKLNNVAIVYIKAKLNSLKLIDQIEELL
ncbi:MAG: tetraacyldisaccharide 4'-kinase [Burkholderiales bacterium]|nr:tetraacyldisaccharide 4'-kinase [Burkholderiales bacterium]